MCNNPADSSLSKASPLDYLLLANHYFSGLNTALMVALSNGVKRMLFSSIHCLGSVRPWWSSQWESL